MLENEHPEESETRRKEWQQVTGREGGGEAEEGEGEEGLRRRRRNQQNLGNMEIEQRRVDSTLVDKFAK